MTRTIEVDEAVNANIKRTVRKTVDEALVLTDTANGKSYLITVENGVLTPVEVVA